MSDSVISPEDMNNFVGLCVVLTGASKNVISPGFDTMNIKEQVYAPAAADNAAALAALLDQYAALVADGKSPTEIIAQIMQPKEQPTALLARSIILAWYSGAWYASAELFAAQQPTARVLSAVAYEQGLMWKVAQAHAMGSADYPFGYWNSPPPPLSQFIAT